MIVSFVTAALLSLGVAQGQATPQDGPIQTNVTRGEATESVRLREALAYSNPLPRGAPTQDYPLVAWCDALVSGHVRLGESLVNISTEDQELVRLGRLEAQDFRDALRVAEPRQNAATRAAARAAAQAASDQWITIQAQEDPDLRSQAFGLFFGLPGRCEHAARRIRDNITTPPATPAEVGLRETPPAS
ncbi:MAG: hypothetical protein KF910_08765 [Brevundimonas sp.]|uniref:hypothetical protein n=1 Tax=Brevundimonas sp. TaxID=1871086 RepID=UPI0025C32DE4|nr:hypothetical protein [Brevundimonas sp.]MBX3477686.1 hypothetical protein [Brevundimonas sp.]